MQDTLNKPRTRKETAEILRCSLVTLNEWTKEGRIRSFNIGRKVYYFDEDIRQAFQENTVNKYKRA